MSDHIGQPAYQQVANDLRRLITSGDLVVGDAIPSTVQLCQRYSVSVTVVRAAINQLRTDGVLRGQPGKAVYVVATPAEVVAEARSLDQLAGEVAELRARLDKKNTSVDDDLREAVQQLRRQVARLQTQLIDLYGRTGHNYPREQPERPNTDARRTAG